MLDIFVPREAWVLSGSMLGWGEDIIRECDAVIFVTLDPAERLRRLEAREVHRRAGEDFDAAAWEKFLEWARGYDDPDFDGRTRVAHEKWLDQLTQPVLRLDSANPTQEVLSQVLSWDPAERRQR